VDAHLNLHFEFEQALVGQYIFQFLAPQIYIPFLKWYRHDGSRVHHCPEIPKGPQEAENHHNRTGVLAVCVLSRHFG